MKQPVSQRDYSKIIDRIAKTLNSNYYLSGFLKNNMDKFVKSTEALESAFKATAEMDSDHYKTEVIKTGLSAQPVSLDAVKIIMKSASSMDSDHYKTEVLTSLLKQNNLNDDIIGEMINATKSIDSDYYRSVVLNKALNKGGLSNASFQRALESKSRHVRDCQAYPRRFSLLPPDPGRRPQVLPGEFPGGLGLPGWLAWPEWPDWPDWEGGLPDGCEDWPER
jgi:hypothetical protein